MDDARAAAALTVDVLTWDGGLKRRAVEAAREELELDEEVSGGEVEELVRGDAVGRTEPAELELMAGRQFEK